MSYYDRDLTEYELNLVELMKEVAEEVYDFKKQLLKLRMTFANINYRIIDKKYKAKTYYKKHIINEFENEEEFILLYSKKSILGLSIDRVDNDSNYSPENCVWTDIKTQNNNRSNNVFVRDNTDNKLYTIGEFKQKYNINKNFCKFYKLNKDSWSDPRVTYVGKLTPELYKERISYRNWNK